VRVLILSPEAPAYPGAGGQSRQHSLLEPLANRYDIRVLTTGAPPVFGAPPLGVDVRHIAPQPPRPAPDGAWLTRNVRHLASGPPWLHYFGLHDCDALGPELVGQLAEFRPDLVQVEHGHLAPLLAGLPEDMPKILSLPNLLIRNQRDILAHRAPRSPFGPATEWMVMARQERRDMVAASAVIVASQRDKRMARRLQPRATVRVVPNCIDVTYFRRNRPRADRPTVVMTATYYWPPNQVAAKDLLTDIFPAVRARVPDAELVLVGQGMPDWLSAMVQVCPGARATGTVDDVRPELQRAWASVAPLRSVAGSQIKVMEALASGVPAVTSPAVAQALGVGEADGVLEAASPAAFADQLAHVLGDPARRGVLAESGVKSAQQFDRIPAARGLESVWLEVAGSKVADLAPA
jgi:glycosyltransferase involved in cell wall biosynthesis